MKTQLSISLISLATATGLFAGSINIVHLGPQDPLKFEVTAGEASVDFPLAHGVATGPFILPKEESVLKTFLEGVPPLQIPVSEDPRMAILAPAEDGYKWHLLPARPTQKEWAFRIINLSPVPANVVTGKKLLEILAGGESTVEVSGKGEINLKIPNTISLKHEGNEACAVVALVYRQDEEWKAILLPDR